MDANSKVAFISSVADGKLIICPKCGSGNEPDSQFCIICGAELTVPEKKEKNVPAFKLHKESAAEEKTVKYDEPKTIFAQGLPEWTVEPPLILVRRH